MRFLKKAGIVCANILLVGCLLCIAFFVPEWFVRIKDESSLEQVKTQKLEQDAYELTYHNFAEKLYTIAFAWARGIVTQLIEMPDNMTEVGDEELTEYVMQEVDAFLEHIWDIDISLEAEELKERKLYMLYGSDAGESSNVVAGIYLYKLTYVTEGFGCDNVELVFYMDTEFSKLYSFSMCTLKSNTSPGEGREFNGQLMRAYEEGLDSVLPVDELIDYWEVEENYQLECDYGDEAVWKDKKSNWGMSSEDYLVLDEKTVSYGIKSPLLIWSYLNYTSFDLFDMRMGLWLVESYTDAEVYDSAFSTMKQ